MLAEIVLKESSRDGIVKAALQKEEDKLLNAIQGLACKKHDGDIRRELLYLREVKASLQEIKDVARDSVIKDELDNTARGLSDAVYNLEASSADFDSSSSGNSQLKMFEREE